MAKIDFDDYADDYNELIRKNLRFFSSDDSYFAWIKIHLMRMCLGRKPGKILEYGAGVGRNLPYLAQYFPDSEIWACDISEKSLRKVRADYPDVRTFLLDDATSQETGEFDLVLVSGVYHHVAPSLRKAVTAQIARFMRIGAELFVFEHNPCNPVTRRLVDRCPYDEDAVLIRASKLRGLLAAGGLCIRQTRYYLFSPPFLKLGWLERWLGMIPLGGQYFVRATKE